MKREREEAAEIPQEEESKGLQKNKDGELFFDLSSKRRITIRQFKNRPLVDIREFYDAGGEMKPGKKGISLTQEQWEALLENRGLIEEALEQLGGKKKKTKEEQ